MLPKRVALRLLGHGALGLALGLGLTQRTAAADPAPPAKAAVVAPEYKVTGTLKEEERLRTGKDPGEGTKLTHWVVVDAQGRLVLLPTAAQLAKSSPTLKVDVATLVNQQVTIVGHGTEKLGKDETGKATPVLILTDITSIVAVPAK